MTTSPVRRTFLLLGLLVLNSCGGKDSMSPSQTVASVTVTPSTGTLDAIGATVQLSAAAKDASGQVVAGTSVTWNSANTNVATVSSSGLVTAVANGTADITAAASGVSGTARITVAQAVATVTVDPAALELTVGETGTVSATEVDANGHPVSGQTVSWSSSDDAVATVDASGLVSAVAEGTATVTAAVGSTSADVAVAVKAPPPFIPTKDTTLSGTMTVAEVMIPQGVTVTMNDDVDLTVNGAVSVAGALTGDCVDVSLNGADAVTVTGSVTTTCSTQPADGEVPMLSIVSAGLLTLDGANITSGGDLVVGNAGAGAGAVAPFAAPARAEVGAGCAVVNNPSLSAGSGASPEGAGKAGGRGGNLTYACAGSPDLSGLSIRSGDGGVGASQTTKGGNATAVGAPGGPGGDLTITAGGPITIHGGLFLIVGSGGPGGNGDATSTDPAVKALATGGDGGNAGNLNVNVSVIGGGTVNVTLGDGGSGGFGKADAANGTETHFDGGDAEGHGGSGGSVLAVVPPTLAGDPSTIVMTTQSHGGTGGFGAGEFGSGKSGTSDHRDGGNAGHLAGFGGAGGSVADPSGSPGTGGELDLVLSRGGVGFNGCPTFTAGGNGGTGGSAAGSPGAGGFDANGAAGLPGEVIYGQVANGGDGGDGVGPGSGGKAGPNSVLELGNVLGRSSSFKDGTDGNQCQADMMTSIAVTSDLNGHEPFIMYTTIQEIVLHPNADGTVTLTSANSRWVGLSGNLDGDNFSATGTGTVAGFSGIPVSITGMLTRDADGNVTGFTGTITIDGSNLPANGDGEHHDVTYSITGTLSGG